jgi:hypothetical protein
MTNLKAAGYSKIKTVEIETFTQPDWFGDKVIETIIYAHVVVTDTQGNVWFHTTNKGETEEGNAEMLRRRGYTNDRCILA